MSTSISTSTTYRPGGVDVHKECNFKACAMTVALCNSRNLETDMAKNPMGT